MLVTLLLESLSPSSFLFSTEDQVSFKLAPKIPYLYSKLGFPLDRT